VNIYCDRKPPKREKMQNVLGSSEVPDLLAAEGVERRDCAVGGPTTQAFFKSMCKKVTTPKNRFKIEKYENFQESTSHFKSTLKELKGFYS
jgi:hypothetical protein